MNEKNFKGVSLENLYFLGKFLIDGNRIKEGCSYIVRRNISQGLVFIKIASDNGYLKAKGYLDDIENKANENNTSVKQYLSNQKFIEKKEEDKLLIDKKLIDIAYNHIIYCYENSLEEINLRFFNKIGEGIKHIRNFIEENPISEEDFIYRQKKMSIYGFMAENNVVPFEVHNDWPINRCFTEGDEKISCLRNKYLKSLEENHESIINSNKDVLEGNEENNNVQNESLNSSLEVNEKDDGVENNNVQKEDLNNSSEADEKNDNTKNISIQEESPVLLEKNEENNNAKKEQILIKKLSNIKNFDLIRQAEEKKQSINNTYNYVYKFCDGDIKGIDVSFFSEPAEYYENLACCGDIKAIVIYAFMLYHGIKTNIDINRSNKFFKIAADFEDPLALFLYTSFLKDAKPSEVVEYFRKSANLGLNIARDRFFNFVVDYNIMGLYSEAEKLFLEAVKQNNNEAIFSYANFLISGRFFKTKYIKEDIEKGLGYLKMLADNGDVRAMHCYASNMYNYNKENIEEISKYYRMVIEAGNVEAMHEFGMILFNNIKSKDDNIQESIEFIKKAADNGHCISANIYARFLKGGLFTVNKDLQEAVRYFKIAVSDDIDNPLDNFVLAAYEYVNLIFFEEGLEKNTEEAVKYLEKVVNLNIDGVKDKEINDTVLKSKNLLGIIYYTEQDFKNVQKSFELLKETENYGNLFASYILYTMYKNGNGTSKNSKKAKKIFSNIISIQDSNALFRLYKKIKEYTNSIEIYNSDLVAIIKKAAQNENCVEARVEYANILRYGDGVEKDTKTALIEFKKLADKYNCTGAIVNYADMLKNGEGTNINIEEAKKYYEKAMIFGSFEAINSYTEIIGIKKLIFKEGKNLELNDDIVNIYNSSNELLKKQIGKIIDNLAVAYSENGNNKEAIKCFNILVELGNIGYLNDIGAIYDGENNRDEAEKYFRMASIKNDHRGLFNYVRFLLFRKNDAISSMLYLNKLQYLENNTNDIKLIEERQIKALQSAILKFIKNNKEEIELSLNKFINEDEENIKYVYECGSDLLKKRKQDIAIIFLETAANKGNSDAMYALSIFCDITGKKEDGAEYLDMAVKHGNEKAIKKLEINEQRAIKEMGDVVENKDKIVPPRSPDNK